MERLNKKQKITIILVLIAIISILAIIVYIRYNSYEEDYETENVSSIDENVIEETSKEEENTIIVHIVGAVNNSGIVKLKEGSRIADAIDAAGGTKEDADLSKINLAYEIEDGQKIYIPSTNEKEEEYITEDSGNNVIINEYSTINKESGENQMININKATESELEELPGIGPAIAERIVDYRKENGKFKSIDDIKNVKGLGDAKFEKIKDNIEV